MGFSFPGPRSHRVLLLARMVCSSALSSEEPYISGLCPATVLDLSVCVLKAPALPPFLSLKIGYSSWLWASSLQQILDISMPRCLDTLTFPDGSPEAGLWEINLMLFLFCFLLGKKETNNWGNGRFLWGYLSSGLGSFICLFPWFYPTRD